MKRVTVVLNDVMCLVDKVCIMTMPTQRLEGKQELQGDRCKRGRRRDVARIKDTFISGFAPLQRSELDTKQGFNLE